MYPDFLVIGAQKSGTTWLYKNLETHPQLWLPPEKEIHFFDFPPLIPFYFLLFASDRSIRHWGKNRLIRDFNKVKQGQQSLSWYMKYYFYIRTKRWYCSLFTPGENQVCGEITPRYSSLNSKNVAKVYKLMPNTKIIYLLRNPVDRMWSDLAMYHRSNFGRNGLNADDERSIVDFLQHSKHLANSKYLNNLAVWEKHFPSSQIFIGFQDQISNEPKKLLQDICHFLDVDDSKFKNFDFLNRRVNSHEYPDIPEQFEKMLAGMFIEDIKKINNRFSNSYTEEWLKSAQDILQQN